MFVTGTGISGTVKAAIIKSKQYCTRLTVLSDNTVLTFGTFHSTQVDKTFTLKENYWTYRYKLFYKLY